MRKLYVFASVIALLAGGLMVRAIAAETASRAAIGSRAPDFTLEDQDGKPISLHDFDGKIVVLEWTNPQCPYVQRHYQAKTMQNLYNKYKGDDVAWLAINSSQSATNQSDKQWVDEQSIPYPVLNDSSGTVGHEYGATNTPGMYVINKDGVLVYMGAIDNDPYGDKGSGKVNYVQQALEEVIAGKPVTTSETKQYGCSVKYAG